MEHAVGRSGYERDSSDAGASGKATFHCRRDQHETPCHIDSHIQDLHQRRVIQFYGTLSVFDKPMVIGNGAGLMCSSTCIPDSSGLSG